MCYKSVADGWSLSIPTLTVQHLRMCVDRTGSVQELSRSEKCQSTVHLMDSKSTLISNNASERYLMLSVSHHSSLSGTYVHRIN